MHKAQLSCVYRTGPTNSSFDSAKFLPKLGLTLLALQLAVFYCLRLSVGQFAQQKPCMMYDGR